MRLTRLTVEQLRNLQHVELRPGPGLNVITGSNGAGKTSLLEAIHLLAYGRSFRGRVRDGLIRSGGAALEVFAEWEEPNAPQVRRAGLRHHGQTWTGRLDGATVDQLGDLCAALAVTTFEPGSHALIGGGGEARRRFLDWGLFHVEPDFLPLWRRYARALKQRNALLKQRGDPHQLDLWDAELVAVGEPLHQRRAAYLERLQPWLAEVSSRLLPQLGETRFTFQPGWRHEDFPLADALLVARDRDLATGFTSVGPHRADWAVRHGMRPAQEALSRGQAKLAALACILAQAEDFAAQRGQWPAILLDDFAAELDRTHQVRLLERLRASGAQVFLTGTEIPEMTTSFDDVRMFHVEHGVVSDRSAA